VIQHDVEFASAGSDGGLRFAELGVRVVGSFVEADDAGDDDGGPFEVGDGAGDEGEADADALVGQVLARNYMSRLNDRGNTKWKFT
jgi:hypothetical protein